MNRAYSLLEVKSFDSERREISGIATTPTPDRMGDIVEPLGASFAPEIPLLWQHDRQSPVGIARFGKPTKDGIPFTASLPKIDEAGRLKDLVDMAWQSVKAGLVRAVSIGFRSLEHSMMNDGGFRFTKSEIIELSLVTIPANAEATIQTVKSLDSAVRVAAFGEKEKSGASDAIKKSTAKKVTKMNVREQIEALELRSKSLSSERLEIQEKAISEGRTKDEAEQERFKEICAELKALSDELADLKEMEGELVAKAAPVTEKTVTKAVSNVVVKNTEKHTDGLAFAKAARALALGSIERRSAVEIARELYQGNDEIIAATGALMTKSAVAAGTTSNATWAKPLVGQESTAFADFVNYLRPQTILGKFGSGGIPALRNVPFRTALISQSSGGNGYWVGEGKPKPLTKFDFARTTLEPLKVANIAVATMELIRDSSPSAATLIRDSLADALRERLDIDFIDPSKTASAGVSPAGILNGVTAIPSSGIDADAVRTDIAALLKAFINANNAPTTGVLVMPATVALTLSLMVNPLGQPEFPGITANGGTLLGLPVITSQYVPTVSAGSTVALINASDVYLGDDGGIELSMSDQASLQMDDNPDSPVTSSTVLVSLWQHNMVGFRAERTINWARRRTTSVAHLSGVKWSL